MHGEIKLKSELGQGTTTTFWIPFNKSQSVKLGSPLVDIRSVPEKFRSDLTITGCVSAPHSIVGDSLPNAAPPQNSRNRTGPGLGATLPEQGPTDDLVQQEIDRKSVHVLVVEDKYVIIPSRVCSFVSMTKLLTCLLQCYQPADRSQDSQKIRIFRECRVEWQGSSRLSVGSSQYDSPNTGYHPYGLPDACTRRLSSDPSHPSS